MVIGVNNDVADAWAAIVCSITILFSLIPLIGEIIHVLKAHYNESK